MYKLSGIRRCTLCLRSPFSHNMHFIIFFESKCILLLDCSDIEFIFILAHNLHAKYIIIIQMAVLIETSLGDIVIDLFYKERPNCQFMFLLLDLAFTFAIHNIIITLSLVVKKLRLGYWWMERAFFPNPLAAHPRNTDRYSPKPHIQTESSTLTRKISKAPSDYEDTYPWWIK